MNPNTTNSKQSDNDLERTLDRRHKRGTMAGTLVVVGAVAASLLVWYFASLPASQPNSGSTSTSAEVDPAATVGPQTPPKPDATGPRRPWWPARVVCRAARHLPTVSC